MLVTDFKFAVFVRGAPPALASGMSLGVGTPGANRMAPGSGSRSPSPLIDRAVQT